MPTERIKFGYLESGNAVEAGASPRAYNVLLDGAGALRRRPGLTTWSGFPESIPEASPVAGMVAFEGALYFVNDYRRLWRISGGAATALSTGGPTTYLAGTGRPVFAVTRQRLVIAGGSTMSKLESGATAMALLGGSPPVCSQVAALAQRLFVDDNTSALTNGRVRFSSTGYTGNESFDALDTFDTEAATDDVVAVRSNSNELWALGERTLQVFSPDPVSIVAPGRTKNRGCGAAASVVQVEEAFAWLDEAKQFVVSDGRSIETISDPIAATLDDIEDVSDAFGFRVNLGPFDCLVWTLETGGSTFCWQRGGGWSQWSTWDYRLGHQAFEASSAYYWPEEDLHLVGLPSGQIAVLDDSATTDLGSPIKAEAWTGVLDHDTAGPKLCRELRVRLRRGQSTAGTVRLSYRMDGGGWSTPLSLSVAGADEDTTLRFQSLGVYRTVQWKLEMSDAADLVVAAVEEDWMPL